MKKKKTLAVKYAREAPYPAMHPPIGSLYSDRIKGCISPAYYISSSFLYTLATITIIQQLLFFTQRSMRDSRSMTLPNKRRIENRYRIRWLSNCNTKNKNQWWNADGSNPVPLTNINLFYGNLNSPNNSEQIDYICSPLQIVFRGSFRTHLHPIIKNIIILGTFTASLLHLWK